MRPQTSFISALIEHASGIEALFRAPPSRLPPIAYRDFVSWLMGFGQWLVWTMVEVQIWVVDCSATNATTVSKGDVQAESAVIIPVFIRCIP